MKDYKDGSGLQFINFDFVTGCQKTKVFILVIVLSFFTSYFSAFVTFGGSFVLHKKIKQA